MSPKLLLVGILSSYPLCAMAEKPTPQVAPTLIQDARSQLEKSEIVADIDHHQLAKKEGVKMPPCRLLMFTHEHSSIPLLSQNPLTAIDLPYRCIVYAENDATKALTTDSAWLNARFALKENAEASAQFDAGFAQVITAPIEKVGATMHDGSPLEKHYALLSIDSDYPYAESEKRLKAIIQSQDDTVWFGSVDFQKLAKQKDVTLPPCTLYLFGGPAPGGVAMAKFPKLGLDAFCQKILLIENPDKTVTLYYNSIADLAIFHYGKAAQPHKKLDQRITATYNKALKKRIDVSD